jgi:hypothetical protein
MDKGKALLSRRGGQRKFLLGMEGREVGVRKLEDDWDCPAVLKLQLYAFADDNVTYLFKHAGVALVFNSFGSAKP